MAHIYDAHMPTYGLMQNTIMRNIAQYTIGVTHNKNFNIIISLL